MDIAAVDTSQDVVEVSYLWRSEDARAVYEDTIRLLADMDRQVSTRAKELRARASTTQAEVESLYDAHRQQRRQVAETAAELFALGTVPSYAIRRPLMEDSGP